MRCAETTDATVGPLPVGSIAGLLLVCATVLGTGFAHAGEDEGRNRTVIATQTMREALDMSTGKTVRMDADRLPTPFDKDVSGIVEIVSMDFGALLDESGTVTLDPDGTISSDPNGIVYGGTTQAAMLEVTGDADSQIQVTVQNLGTGGFTLSNFVTNFGAVPLNDQLDNTGSFMFTLGATLAIDHLSVDPGVGQRIAYQVVVITP